MKKKEGAAFVIFGASGDLTFRKLIPAIYDLYASSSLPEHFIVLGIGRSEFSNDSFADKMKQGIHQFSQRESDDEIKINKFLEKLKYLQIDTSKEEDYDRLNCKLKQLNDLYHLDNNIIFYFSTPPSLYSVIASSLAKYGLNDESDGYRRIIVEKPFGKDLESAITLNKKLLAHYAEKQIYRIDHYLGKETVQNILVTRFANGIYEPLWNRNYVEHVEITAAENIGVEGRGGYYDSSGALRDMVQNHLMQLIALTAMEPPTKLLAEDIHYEKLKVFQALRPMSESDIEHNVVRGQYLASTIKGKSVLGYREEKGVQPDSRTETFIAMKIFIDNWRWAGVPFYIRTGKRLPTRVSEIVIRFKKTPQQLFSGVESGTDWTNQLVIRIQPDEGILLRTGMKVPGKGYEVKSVNMDFHYSDLKNVYVPSAYERLILDCISGDNVLFMNGKELEETWNFVQPILDYWKEHPDKKLYGYPAGSWGPEATESLMHSEGITWRYPCKNLTSDDTYCEL